MKFSKHGFIKKSQKTPKQELNLAKERKLKVKGAAKLHKSFQKL
ncbi:MAG: type II toxin-antitoxin system RelE/ParE family toxin [Hassallia sp.]